MDQTSQNATKVTTRLTNGTSAATIEFASVTAVETQQHISRRGKLRTDHLMGSIVMKPASKTAAWLGVLLAISATLSRADDQPMVAFENKSNSLPITIGGKLFATYVFDDGPTTRPFFKHIHAPDGSQVTRNHPPDPQKDLTDHATFHPGLWLAFGDLNGADFWRNKDRVRHVAFVDGPRKGPGRMPANGD
jgi:hypothetical protein